MEFFNAAAAADIVVVTFIVAITINVNAADWIIAPLPSMDECSALKTFYKVGLKRSWEFVLFSHHSRQPRKCSHSLLLQPSTGGDTFCYFQGGREALAAVRTFLRAAIFAAFTAPFLAAPQGISLATCPEYHVGRPRPPGPFCTSQNWAFMSRLRHQNCT